MIFFILLYNSFLNRIDLIPNKLVCIGLEVSISFPDRETIISCSKAKIDLIPSKIVFVL